MRDVGKPEEVAVRKLDPQGRLVTTYPATVLERTADGIVLDARWTRPTLDLGYTTFETGDRFIEWFFTNRWYNIFEIRGGDGRLKGWYCNIAAPARITTDDVSCRDLLLDLWVAPDGRMRTLDEDEFAEETCLTADERTRALAAIEELRSMVRRDAPPFSHT